MYDSDCKVAINKINLKYRRAGRKMHLYRDLPYVVSNVPKFFREATCEVKIDIKGYGERDLDIDKAVRLLYRLRKHCVSGPQEFFTLGGKLEVNPEPQWPWEQDAILVLRPTNSSLVEEH